MKKYVAILQDLHIFRGIRMCNLDGWQSPLPKEWLSSQAELQEQIVAREREFNMQPVLPAFAGHVPAALKRVYPNIKTSRVSEWEDSPINIVALSLTLWILCMRSYKRISYRTNSFVWHKSYLWYRSV